MSLSAFPRGTLIFIAFLCYRYYFSGPLPHVSIMLAVQSMPLAVQSLPQGMPEQM